MKGEVEKVWSNQTADGRKYNVLQVGGERYSLWDEGYLDRIQEGQSLEFDFRESGEFRNITKIYDIPENERPETAKEPTYNDRRNRNIIKMSCLRSASKILSGSRIPCEKRAEKTIEIAKKFEKYVDDEGFEEPESED